MTETMRVVGYRTSLPIQDPASLVDAVVPVPTPDGHDLLVRVEAVSVNPVDVKVRRGSDPKGELKVLGYDAAGVVDAIGDEVTLFRPGDKVYYAGSIDRPGTNAQFHLVDERIVGRKPASLTFAEAAALPLTTITAWESLYERFRVSPTSQGTLLILGAAGGVGSMLVQLAAHLTNLTIVGTASRQASRAWATELGAHHVIDHHGDLASRVLDCVPEGVDYIFSPHSEGNIAAYAKVLKPYGHITAIDEPAGLDLLPLKPKSISWHWELMFTRPLLCPQDTAQHDLLNAAATLIDEGAFRTTMTTQLGPINAATMREAHAQIEGSATVGKIVVAGF